MTIIRTHVTFQRIGFLLLVGLLSLFGYAHTFAAPLSQSADSSKRKADLAKILEDLPPERLSNGRVSFLDETFKDWLTRTGELPPDYDSLPSIPFLPDPFIKDEGGENIPITTMAQWKEKRQWMKKELQHYITGTYPPPPDNLKVTLVNERKDGETTVRMVELSFGPDHQAKLTIELMIPPGEGPFPVFMTQWNHRGWAQVAVRRGYIGCVYAAADAKDDTEKYSEIWAHQYDFTRLMRRAYGTFRAIDYLYTLPFVDKGKIALTGHSRNGKLSLMAAAFDERIAAVIPSSGGTGAEVPWRYTAQQYDVEDIALLSTAQPAWLHPRLRFFVGRENKLPVDQNLFMALIAPRGLMLSTAITEGASNPWGIEQVYHATEKVYKFFGAEDQLAIRARYGLHGTHAGDMEDYVDFFDFVFKRTDRKPENKLRYTYSFEQWRDRSGERIDPNQYPAKGLDDLAMDANGKALDIQQWKDKKLAIQQQVRAMLGKAPAGVTNYGPKTLDKGGAGETKFGTFLKRPGETAKMGRMAITPYDGFGDYLYGYLYYPKGSDGKIKKGKLPILIYQHEYDYSKGFSSYHRIEKFIQGMVDRGYAVFAYDMLGFGNRIEEGTHFYDRYPHWSKMGKMVVDLQGAVDAMVNLDFVDSTKVMVAGYSLGATVGLYAAALDERIAGLVSVCGFTPMRLDTPEKGTEGIKAYSHLHGLLPRLGFFVGNEAHIPYDFHELLACVAPRPVLVIAPTMDKTITLKDVELAVDKAKGVYRSMGKADNIGILTPYDYNRFSPEMQEKIAEWAIQNFK